jgi:outer membrane protein assembly factor BamB
MRIISFSIVPLLAACGSHEPERNVTPSQPPAAEAPRPAPGLDLDGPIPVPDPNAQLARPRSPGVIDLTTDRALVKVSVPVPPHGGAVRFTFADDRNAWVTRIPDSHQLPSVAYAHDKIYVSGGFESVTFYALQASTGEIEWATTNLEDNGPTAAVIVDDDVLFNTESCTLFSLSASTGKRNWHRYLGDPTLSQIAVTDGLVYAAHPMDPGNQGYANVAGTGYYLSAFKVKTGAPVWSRSVGSELLATPVIAGDSIYVSTIAGRTYRIDHRSGRVRWSKPLHATTAPWIAGDELFVSRRMGGKEQQVVVSTATGALLREHQLSTGSYTGDVPTNLADWKSVWAFEGSRPVVDRGIRYVAMGNEVHASNALSGDAIWSRRYPGDANKRSLGSIALAGSAVVVSSRDGKIFGLDVDTGYTLWSYDIGLRIAAEPVIAKGWLYATTTDGYVVALDVADPTLDGWHNFGGNAQKNGPVIAPPPPSNGESGNVGSTAAVATPADDVIAKAQVELDREAAIAKKAADEQARRDAAIKKEREDRLKPFVISDKCANNPLC